jgi:hypothetical protein
MTTQILEDKWTKYFHRRYFHQLCMTMNNILRKKKIRNPETYQILDKHMDEFICYANWKGELKRSTIENIIERIMCKNNLS